MNNNNLNFQFGMYEPTTDSVIVNAGENFVLVIRCKECNSSVIFEEPNDIAYLYGRQKIHHLHMPRLH